MLRSDQNNIRFVRKRNAFDLYKLPTLSSNLLLIDGSGSVLTNAVLSRSRPFAETPQSSSSGEEGDPSSAGHVVGGLVLGLLVTVVFLIAAAVAVTAASFTRRRRRQDDIESRPDQNHINIMHVRGQYNVSHPLVQPGFVKRFLRSFIGWLSRTVATYCPSRSSELMKKNITKYSPRADSNCDTLYLRETWWPGGAWRGIYATSMSDICS